MTFLSVLFALILEHYVSWHRRDRLLAPYLRWTAWLRRVLDSGTARHGILALVLALLPVLALGVLLHFGPLLLGGVALAWLVDLLVLGAVIDFKTLSDRLGQIGSLLRSEHWPQAAAAIEDWEGGALPGEFDGAGLASRAIQLALLHAHWRVLVPILWFVLLPGACGPLLYSATLTVQRQWLAAGADGGEFGRPAAILLGWLDWLPARLTALSFAVVGNFEESLFCWRNQTHQTPADDARVVLAAGAGAIGVHFEPAPVLPYGVINGDLGTGDFPGAEHLQNAEGLLARTLVLSVVLLGLLTLGGLVSI